MASPGEETEKTAGMGRAGVAFAHRGTAGLGSAADSEEQLMVSTGATLPV